MNNVFTYYQPLDIRHSGEQAEMIRHWKRSWAKQGWNPRVLGIEDARRHPMFDEFDARVRKLPTVNSVDYEVACYHRWLAVAAAGGGFMSDYDVVNYGFKPKPIQSDLTIYESDYCCDSVTPSVVGGTSYGFLNACFCFSVCEPESITSDFGDRKHTSDMIVMQMMSDRGVFIIAPTVRQYGQADWDSAELVHYCHSTTHNTDRVQCMKTARPI